MKKLNWKTELYLKQQEILDWKMRQTLHSVKELRKQGFRWKDILPFANL